MTYFHMGRPHTIIGADSFHFRVRDGIGWYRDAMIAGNWVDLMCLNFNVAAVSVNLTFNPNSECQNSREFSKYHVHFILQSLKGRSTYNIKAFFHKWKLLGCYMVKPHGQLVQVSFTRHRASTPCLSTL